MSADSPSSRKAILIVTHRRGFESDSVIDGLRERGVRVFRLNADLHDRVATVSVSPSEGHLRFSCDGRSITSGEIHSAWYQQPPPAPDDRDAPDALTLRAPTFDAAWLGSLELLDCQWLNRPSSVHRAANKIAQLRAATASGLGVPPTMVSNDPGDVRRFARDSGPTVAKNLATPWLDRSGTVMAAQTRAFPTTATDDAIRFAPVIYQAFRERRREFRVVLVGEESFVVAREVLPTDPRYDSRAGRLDPTSYAPSHLPTETLAALRRLTASFGLDYCSADFMEDIEGRTFFLDLNATGAWWWVDDVLGGRIRRAIEDFLAQGMR